MLCCMVYAVHGQRFYGAVFTQLPADYQLYPRNAQNTATVAIEGRYEQANGSYFSVQVFRENSAILYQRAPLTYTTAAVATFRFNPITIKAELAEYQFKVYLINKNNDSVLVVNREHVVAGDVYVLSGQSNALAIVSDNIIPYRNKFARTFGASFPSQAMVWSMSEYGIEHVGQIGGELQKQIIEKYGIPVCILNRAVGGISIGASIIRNPDNIEDNATTYGSTYSVIKNAGLLNGGIKAWIWRQGENEASGSSIHWASKFDILYQYWHTDYPLISKYYVFQIGIIAYPEGPAGLMRDFQRRTKTIYKDVDNITCIGTKGYDGIHYDSSGHKQTAKELFRMIDRDFYQGSYADNINSPNVQRAYFSNPEKTEITLAFEPDQKMVWVEDTLLLDKSKNWVKQFMRNNFYFDGNGLNDLVVSGTARDNKIILTLKSSPPQNKFNYLPSFHIDNQFAVFGGPFLKNKLGMRAFSFDQVTIEDYQPVLASPELAAEVNSPKEIKLTWRLVDKALRYTLERKSSPTGAYTLVASFSNKEQLYVDSTLQSNTTYYYRMRALGELVNSDYTEVQAQTSQLLGIPSLSVVPLSPTGVTLAWTNVSGAQLYVLERKETVAGTYQEIVRLTSDKTSYQDVNLLPNTTYAYRIKALSAKSYSDYGSASGKTAALLSSPITSVEVLSPTTLHITSIVVAGATAFVLERKTSLTDSYKELVRFSTVGNVDYLDSGLVANTTYYYRVKAFSTNSYSEYATSLGTTSAMLLAPIAKIEVLSPTALRLTTNAVSGVTNFVVERKIGETGAYKELVRLSANNQINLIDSNLVDNTHYYYRVKGYGLKSYSDFVIVDGRTTKILDTPLVKAETPSPFSIKLSWDAISNATSYEIYRKYFLYGPYSYVGQTTSDKTFFLDTGLNSATKYEYQVLALGDKTYSKAGMIGLQTSFVLGESTENPISAYSFYPNPTDADLTVLLPQPSTDVLKMVDLMGVTVVQIPLTNQVQVTIPTQYLPNGVYYIHLSKIGFIGKVILY